MYMTYEFIADIHALIAGSDKSLYGATLLGCLTMMLGLLGCDLNFKYHLILSSNALRSNFRGSILGMFC